MKKIITSIILVTSLISLNAISKAQAGNDIITPDKVVSKIITDAILSLKELKKQNQSSTENIADLIKTKILPNIATDEFLQLSLEDHLDKLTQEQKTLLKKYLTTSLTKDYAQIFVSYNDLSSVNIKTNPVVKYKSNKAIVKLEITTSTNHVPNKITLKMIYYGKWLIYDIVFQGVSLVKSYKSQFNSHIKRKGIDSLLAKIKSNA